MADFPPTPCTGDYYRDATLPDDQAVDVGHVMKATHVYTGSGWVRLPVPHTCITCGEPIDLSGVWASDGLRHVWCLGPPQPEPSPFHHVVLKEGEVVILATKGRLSLEHYEGFQESLPEPWRDRVLLVDGTQVDVTVVSREDPIASGLPEGPIGDPPDPESDRT